MKAIMKELVNRRDQLEKGVIPFVEPNSLEEEMAFNELIFINKQIGTLAGFLKKELIFNK